MIRTAKNPANLRGDSSEATAGVSERSIQTKPASEQPNSGATPPQVSEGRLYYPRKELCPTSWGKPLQKNNAPHYPF